MKLARMGVLSAILALSLAGQAQAVDVKASGSWDFTMGWADNTTFYDHRNGNGPAPDDTFGAAQRIRTQVNFIASEQLQGVMMFEIGDLRWGSNDTDGRSGGALDADGVNVETKRAYLDWIIPGTEVTVRMGIQGLSLPMATGYCSPVFSADVAGAVVSTPVHENVALTAFWLRPFDAYGTDPGGRHYDDEMDMFGLILPVSGEGWGVTPWGMYANVGSASGFYDYAMQNDPAEFTVGGNENKSADAWWGGVGIELSMFDPLTFAVDAMYGHLEKKSLNFVDAVTPATGSMDFGTSGWFVVAALNYKLDWATPGLFGWYATGDDKGDVQDGKYGRMPVVGTDDGFGPTTFGFPGSASIGTDSLIGLTGVGTWGIGVQLADISFIENLNHTLRFAYYQGTNDHEIVRDGLAWYPSGGEAIYMTDKDRAYEVNFDHSWNMYENLTVFLETGYIKLDLDKGTWGDAHNTDDAWKAQVSFQYNF